MTKTSEINVLTDQENILLDNISAGLITQGGPATTRNKVGYMSCRYRGDGNSACGVGQIIPDELYSPEFETKTALQLPDEIFAKIFGRETTDRDYQFLTAVQTIHDDYIAYGYNENWAEYITRSADKLRTNFIG